MSVLEQKRRSPRDVFPSPAQGETVDDTPPAFVWLPEEGCRVYCLEVKDEKGVTCLEIETPDKHYIPPSPLPPGDYRWRVSAQGDAREWWTFRISSEAKVRTVPSAEDLLEKVPNEHPRHLFRKKDIDDILRRTPDECAILRKNIDIAIRDGMPPRPRFHHDPEALPYREAFVQHRRFCDRNLVACALGHALLQDSGAADYARRSLLTIIDWNPAGPCSVTGAWGDEFGLSHARCLPAVYDMTYDLFDNRERGYIEKTIAVYAQQMEERLRRLDFISHPGESHSGRLPAYLGEAALVLKGSNQVDESQLNSWLDYALEIYGSSFPFFGGRDGGWAQGTFYASTYTKWYLPFFIAIEQLTGFSFFEKPFFRNLSHFFLHFYGIGRESYPFGDGNWCQPRDEEWPGFCAQNPYRVYAERFGPDLADTWRQRLNNPEHYELHLLDIFTALPPSSGKCESAPVENCRVFRDTGLVSMHSAIETPEEDVAVLARASRYGNFSHSHADQGSFAIISNGVTMVGPSGYYGRRFGTAHHTQWTRQTIAHNCLTVDGVGQEWGTHTATAEVKYLHDDGTHAVALLDCSQSYPMLSTYRRWLMLIRPGVVLVVDEVCSSSPHLFEWRLHSLSEPQQRGDKLVIERKGVTCNITTIASAACTGYTCTDAFATPVNEGVPDAYAVEMPVQYHMTWEYANTSTIRIAGIFGLNGAEVSFTHKDGQTQIMTPAGMVTLQLSGEDAVGEPIVKTPSGEYLMPSEEKAD